MAGYLSAIIFLIDHMNITTLLRSGISLALLGMAALGTSCSLQQKEQQKPNIIFVLADDLGPGDLQFNNTECKIPTPNLNEMAEGGLTFTDAHTSSAVCTPTRYGILTGRYNWRSGLKSFVLFGYDDHLIPSDRKTVASMLQENGYTTGFIGKWHLGWDWAKDENGKIDFSKPVSNGPKDLGFDYSYGHIGSLDMPPYVYVENGMATSTEIDSIKAKHGYAFYRGGEIASDFSIEDVTPNFFRRAEQFITDNAAKEQPFFLYLPIPSPHTPIVPTPEWQGKSGMNPYADFVMMIDHYMGSLNNKLVELGIDENTLIVFTSDNGCSPTANYKALAEFDHDPSGIFRGHKADAFEGGHRVPFVVKWPAGIDAGSSSDQTICTTDFLATCADIAGITLSEDIGEDSYSLTPFFKAGQADEFGRDYTVHHSIEGDFAITKGEWKLLLCPGSGGWSAPRDGKAVKDGLPPMQLYKISTDPSETTNVHTEHPEVVKDLFQTLMHCIDQGRSTEGVPQTNDPDKFREWKQLTDLKALYQETMAQA